MSNALLSQVKCHHLVRLKVSVPFDVSFHDLLVCWIDMLWLFTSITNGVSRSCSCSTPSIRLLICHINGYSLCNSKWIKRIFFKIFTWIIYIFKICTSYYGEEKFNHFTIFVTLCCEWYQLDIICMSKSIKPTH